MSVTELHSGVVPTQRSGSRWIDRMIRLPKEVWDQFTGSDLQSGYSFVYVWLANQFGHFMIGFAGLILFTWLWSIFLPGIVTSGGFLDRLIPAAALGALWSGIWVLKELLFDVAGALRDLRTAALQREALANGKPLPPAPRSRPSLRDMPAALAAVFEVVKERFRKSHLCFGTAAHEAFFMETVVRDCLADVRFYVAGVVTAVMMYAAPGLAYSDHHPSIVGALPIATFLVVLVLLAVISRPWLWQKVAFDKAMLPSVTRFALSMSPHDEAERVKALAFGYSGMPEGHLVIIGPPKSGRTSLAIAIGVEALLTPEAERPGGEHGNVLYTSLWRLLDRAAEEKQGVPESKLQGQPGERPVWPLQEARLLIVDDISAQAHDGRSLLSPAAFAHELRNNQAVLEMCRGKRVMWVISDDSRNSADWTEAIADAFHLSSPTEVQVVELNHIIDQAARLRPLRRAA